MRWMLFSFLFAAACGVLPDQSGPDTGGGDAVQGPLIATPTRPQARPDTPAPAEPAASEVSVGTLGRTVASLGNAAEPGLWLKTPLVRVERQGRVHNPANGKSVAVTLIPIEGERTAGSRMSLAAMQAVGLPLTALAEVDVFGT